MRRSVPWPPPDGAREWLGEAVEYACGLFDANDWPTGTDRRPYVLGYLLRLTRLGVDQQLELNDALREGRPCRRDPEVAP